MGYALLYASKHDSSGEGELIGYRKFVFELKRSEILELNDVGGGEDYKRDNVVPIVELKHRSLNYTVCVASAHLYYHPNVEHVRLSQMNYILDRVELYLLTYYSSLRSAKNVATRSTASSYVAILTHSQWIRAGRLDGCWGGIWTS